MVVSNAPGHKELLPPTLILNSQQYFLDDQGLDEEVVYLEEVNTHNNTEFHTSNCAYNK